MKYCLECSNLCYGYEKFCPRCGKGTVETEFKCPYCEEAVSIVDRFCTRGCGKPIQEAVEEQKKRLREEVR